MIIYLREIQIKVDSFRYYHPMWKIGSHPLRYLTMEMLVGYRL